MIEYTMSQFANKDDMIFAMRAEITTLRAELEIAKKDGERYQWLRKRAFLNRFGWVFENIKYYKEPTTIDEDIDNAMRGE